MKMGWYLSGMPAMSLLLTLSVLPVPVGPTAIVCILCCASVSVIHM